MTGQWGGISRIRVVIGAMGGLLAMFGVLRLASEVPTGHLLALGVWLVVALILHDAVLSPAVVGIGALLHKVPARARTYLQSALIVGGLVTVIAIPMIYRQGSQPGVKAILDQDFRLNLTVLLGVITVAASASYLLRVVSERRTSSRAGSTSDRPPEEP